MPAGSFGKPQNQHRNPSLGWIPAERTHLMCPHLVARCLTCQDGAFQGFGSRAVLAQAPFMDGQVRPRPKSRHLGYLSIQSGVYLEHLDPNLA